MRFVAYTLAVVVLWATPLGANPTFSDAKRELRYLYLFLDSSFQKDFYCQIPFSTRLYRGKPQLRPLPQALSDFGIKKQSSTIEWEHIMPAHTFGKHLVCWVQGGRKKCQKNPLFQKMESDTQNIVPTIGQINRDRRNYAYADAPKFMRFTQYGKCEVYVDTKTQRFYPAAYSKGYIARSYLYMVKTYNIPLDSDTIAQMREWDRIYPMSEQEQYLRHQLGLINQKLIVQSLSKLLQ